MANGMDLDAIVNAAESGDYAADCAMGREMADCFVEECQSPPALGSIVRRLMARGQFNGVHIGFFHRISEFALQ